MENIILNGNSLEILKTLPDNLVDMVITSPPYWGLRDYGLPDCIYGGDKNCNHEWMENIKKPAGGKGSLCANVGANKNDFANARDHNIISGFCVKCGAWKGQLGQEPDYHDYLNHLFEIIKECSRVTKDNGSIWINLGDSYCGTGNKGNYRDPKYKDGRNGQAVSKNRIVEGIKQKSLIGIPDRFKIMMIDNGFICRNEIIWKKNNQMPSSAKDKFTVDFEKLYFFTKNRRYYFEQQFEPFVSKENHTKRNRIKEGKYNGTKQFSDGYRDFYNKGLRNKRCIWEVNTQPLKDPHFASYPEKLIEIPIKACCPECGIVLDPFFGSGTTGLVALKQNKFYIGIELSEGYIQIAKNRLAKLDNDKI
jgi:site-specific DNA-methyltransferase (adenine-specific)